ncbi:hypothetical protein GK047_18985 [Paenibacillus sp. SYP-B3998]|uniref:Uncharacterized protein n=1 Tax=Paenibacillus sp. SYP-B3998 TaxID=2678564 RepID=A0A6G4A173_9BACL|nr:hypothetical protein [Paenibacillus sp. SYP-B3998]NEW08090.1 hypothetical protein [Paenibacillus sp. SYP-B3998]
MAKSVRKSASTKVSVRDRASNIPGWNIKNHAASSKKPRKREKGKPSLAKYRRRVWKQYRTWNNSEESSRVEDRHGMKDNAVNWYMLQ